MPLAQTADKFDIFSALSNDYTNLSIGTLIISLFIALAIALFIYFVYKFTYSGVTFNRNFGATIVMTTLVTAVIMMIIGSNLALSLGMVGALSIIRFRNAVKDSRDIAFIFWAVSSGLAAGAGIYSIAFLGTLFIGIFVIVFNILGFSSKTYLLIMKTEDGLNNETLDNVLDENTRRYRMRMKNYSNKMSEIIYELQPSRGAEESIVEKVSSIEHVKSVNLVSSSEDL
jgi:uncharacterized membrane protein YhiD involved in acid resistance